MRYVWLFDAGVVEAVEVVVLGVEELEVDFDDEELEDELDEGEDEEPPTTHLPAASCVAPYFAASFADTTSGIWLYYQIIKSEYVYSFSISLTLATARSTTFAILSETADTLSPLNIRH